jgi:hypothetical protein
MERIEQEIFPDARPRSEVVVVVVVCTCGTDPLGNHDPNCPVTQEAMRRTT